MNELTAIAPTHSRNLLRFMSRTTNRINITTFRSGAAAPDGAWIVTLTSRLTLVWAVEEALLAKAKNRFMSGLSVLDLDFDLRD